MRRKSRTLHKLFVAFAEILLCLGIGLIFGDILSISAQYNSGSIGTVNKDAMPIRRKRFADIIRWARRCIGALPDHATYIEDTAS